FGVLRPGASQAWRKPGQVVIEKETGAAYVLGADGSLHPVLNYASARRLAGGDGTATTTVSARSRAGVARGVPLGIAGAPDSLPAADRLIPGPWAACSAPADGPRPTTTVLLGARPATGGPGPQEALLVADPADHRFVVVDGRRLRIVDTTVTSLALGLTAVAPLVVSDAWLGAVPAGPDLAPITIADSGRAGPVVGGRPTVVGQVLVVDGIGSGRRYYIVRPASLEAVTETEAAQILNNPANRRAYPNGAAQAIAVS